jgi:two-component system C4-dicarboxylate transport response regulator DctD
LRERREDVPLLFEHFMLLAASRFQRAAPMLSSIQLRELMAYTWPGNVRELRNVADRFVLGLLGDRLNLEKSGDSQPNSLPEQLEHFERSIIQEELRRYHGDVGLCAKALGLPKQTLYDKLRRLRLSNDEFKEHH